MIDFSSLTKFRKLPLKNLDLFDMLIHKILEIAIEKGIKALVHEDRAS